MGAAQAMLSFVGLVLIVAIVVGVALTVRNVRRSNAAGEAASAEAELLRHEAAKERDIEVVSDMTDAEAAKEWTEFFGEGKP